MEPSPALTTRRSTRHTRQGSELALLPKRLKPSRNATSFLTREDEEGVEREDKEEEQNEREEEEDDDNRVESLTRRNNDPDYRVTSRSRTRATDLDNTPYETP
jgi:hypothetical protein